MSTPRLSVIVPVFNGEKYLRQALESVPRLEPPIEIIVVNDGSTDQTAAVAKAFPSPLIYIEQIRAGPAAARNRGVEAAKGELIGFLDADDVWAPGHPGEALAYLERNPEVDLVLGQIQPLIRDSSGTEAFAPSGKPFHTYQVGAAIVRREALAKVGTFAPALRYGEDVDWFLRLRESGGTIAMLPDVSLFYRLHSDNQAGIYQNSRTGLLAAFHNALQRRRLASDCEKTTVAHPLISVIIPVWNGERFIADAIKSVLAQDYRPLELIVVDDGSTDRTREIVRHFPLANLQEQTHRGAGVARNSGVRRARGELLAFLDADDLWVPEKLSRQWQRLTAQSGTEAVFAHVEEFQEGTAATVGPRPGPLPSTMLIWRSAFDRVGWFDEQSRSLEGVDWYLRAMEKSLRAEMLPQVLYRRRHHGNNRSIIDRDLNGYVRAIKASLDRRRSTENSPPAC